MPQRTQLLPAVPGPAPAAPQTSAYVDAGYENHLQHRPDGTVGHQWRAPLDDVFEDDAELFAAFLVNRERRRQERDAQRVTGARQLFSIPGGKR